MERIDFLRDSIIQVMTEYAEYLSSSGYLLFDYELRVDEKHDKYELFTIDCGRDDYYIIFCVSIANTKVCIEEDTTEDGFDNLLLEKGVEKEEIVLAYYRKYH